ncbi:MAG: Bax inhibitor-1/YccA family protein [Hyphomonas sp.]|uniref:Bax inhibitor-1/YccA family protein n=1 Tax=Hyphomonas sp. TaxID=87 RepID=UPI0034A02B81
MQAAVDLVGRAGDALMDAVMATAGRPAGAGFGEIGQRLVHSAIARKDPFQDFCCFGKAQFLRQANDVALTANLLYWTGASLIGAWVLAARLGTGADFLTIAKAFFITAAAFGALSLWFYTTRRDLSAFGTIPVMGVVGLVLASLTNLIFQSSLLSFAISVIGVVVFSALTGFDTQRQKQGYDTLEGDVRSMAVATSLGALSLCLNFVNLFQFILSILSPREE